MVGDVAGFCKNQRGYDVVGFCKTQQGYDVAMFETNLFLKF